MSARRALGACLLLAISLGVLRLLSLQGLVKPARVVSGSMAPAILGQHRALPCGDCRCLLRIDAAQIQGHDSVVCPNCGFAGNALDGAKPLPGERVLIDRGVYLCRSPRRWDIVAFADPTEESELTVKRVVGLPAETVEVRGGDLYLDDHIARKSLEELREMAVPVYDDRFRTRNERLPSRWRDDEGRWTGTEGVYSFAGDLQPLARGAGPRFSWLVYHHWRCSPLPGLRTKESPVLDDDGYNLGPPRQLNPVSDLMLHARIQASGDGWLAVALEDGESRFELRLRPWRGEASLWRDGSKIADGAFERRGDDQSFIMEAALCDQQLLAAVDGVTVFGEPYEPIDGLRNPGTQPIAIGAAGLGAEVSELIISRDIYHLPPPGKEHWSYEPSSSDEYLMLGDNAAISQDSRTWPAPGVSHERIRGRVLQLWETR